MSTRSDRALVGEQLGAFVSDTGWADLDDALRHEASRCLVNFFGAALGAGRDPAVERAVAVLGGFSGGADASLIGRSRRMDAMSAAYVNALTGNLLDYDDTHLETVIHPTAPVAPPVLALAEQHGRSGEDVLLALVLGAEVACGLGLGVSPGHYARGWHITASCGVFGAAAAVARLLGLSPGQTWHALGIAASQAAGLVENLASGAKNAGVGNAARNGLLAALLAREGYTAAPTAIEGPLGWARASGDAPDVAAMTGELGERWEFARNTYKPYPCGIVMHSVIDACLALREQHHLAPESIESVTVCGDALLLARGDRTVRNTRDARVSIAHCAAVSLLHGRAGPAEFSEECVGSEAVAALRERVVAREVGGLPTGAARVSVTAAQGSTLEHTVHDARGSIARPLSNLELSDKLAECIELGGSGCRADALGDALWSLAGAPDIARVMDLARPST